MRAGQIKETEKILQAACLLIGRAQHAEILDADF
jgi:hypothetical protein